MNDLLFQNFLPKLLEQPVRSKDYFRLQNSIVVLHVPFFGLFVLLLISLAFPRVCTTTPQRVLKISCGRILENGLIVKIVD